VVNFKVIVGHGSRLPDQLEALYVDVEFVFAAADILHLDAFVLVVENIVLWNVSNIPYREVYIEWFLRSVSW
jgi:hypothetical protein